MHLIPVVRHCIARSSRGYVHVGLCRNYLNCRTKINVKKMCEYALCMYMYIHETLTTLVLVHFEDSTRTGIGPHLKERATGSRVYSSLSLHSSLQPTRPRPSA